MHAGRFEVKSNLVHPNSSDALRRYFSSGWAFLIPYVGVYLLYAVGNWPVHAVQFGDTPPSWMPALVPVFQTIHFLHAALGIYAIRLWWATTPASGPDAAFERLWPLTPWLLLGLLLWIPGAYLEFPSDPWEHYRRINNWQIFATVRECTYWAKSHYFLLYTLVGPGDPAGQQKWLRACEAFGSLLVCWQYYRLALACGLGKKSAFAFVLLLLPLLGNTIFSFFRYYGLGSTLPAHVAAIATIRLAREFLQPSTAPTSLQKWLSAAAGIGALGVLMLFNHIQAALLALAGLLGLGLGRIAQWRPRALLWLAVGIVIASALLVTWIHGRSSVLDSYRANGWLNSWYGFDLFSSDAARERIVRMLGAFGLVNLAAGVWLIRRNHVVGWLTATPILLLLCPLFTVPFAQQLSLLASDGIVMFPRILLGIPAGLAIVTLLAEWAPQRTLPTAMLHAGLVVFAATLVLIPPTAPFFNRIWHAWETPPRDLSLNHVLATASGPSRANWREPVADHFLTSPGLSFALAATGVRRISYDERLILYPRVTAPSLAAERTSALLDEARFQHTWIYFPSPFNLTSATSLAAFQSGHWLPQEVALQHASGAEIKRAAIDWHAQPQGEAREGLFLFPPRSR